MDIGIVCFEKVEEVIVCIVFLVLVELEFIYGEWINMVVCD